MQNAEDTWRLLTKAEAVCYTKNRKTARRQDNSPSYLAVHMMGDDDMKTFLSNILVTMIAVCTIVCFLCSCNSIDKFEYYSQKENYINATGTISSLRYNDDSTALYIEFSDLSYAFDDVCFKIVGENLQITKTNGIDDKIKVGQRVSFTTAPKYFGDGYVMPVVAISVNEENLLDFEEGHANLLSWLSK